LKLHDTTIGHIAKLVQIAILTGTDVVDHLRMLTLKNDEEFLHLEDEYYEIFNSQVERMLQNASTVQEKSEESLEEQ
tara:strand:+ start:3411 stop:3641 length:231 start_codon:yes stop_codon:yes gene_type:complete